MTSVPTPDPGRSAREASTGDRIGFVVLFVVQLVLSVCLAFLVLIAQFAFDACSGQACDSSLGEAALLIGWIGIALTIVATVVASILLALRRRRIWWVPLAGVAAAFGLFLLSAALTNQAASAPGL